MDDDETHLSENDARAGATPHIARYVLGFSLALVVIAFVATYLLAR